jgi:hypothetical protein
VTRKALLKKIDRLLQACEVLSRPGAPPCATPNVAATVKRAIATMVSTHIDGINERARRARRDAGR